MRPLALIVFPHQQLFREHLLGMLHIPSAGRRWNLEVESGGGFTLGGSGYHTSTQFLFRKSVKVCYKISLVLAQRQPGDNKQTSAPSSEGLVGTQTKRLSDL